MNNKRPSSETLIRLLTPENRRLLALIRDRRPDSVAALAVLAGRAQPNLTRSLGKLEAAGLVVMEQRGRRRAPVAAIRRIVVEIDPCAQSDRLRVSRAAR